MSRLFAYPLFCLGIAIAIVGSAKLPQKQVEFLNMQSQLNEELAALDASLTDEQQPELSTDQQAALRKNQATVQQALQDLEGWPPNSARERFSDALPLFWVGVGLAGVGLVLWRTQTKQRRLDVAGELNETNRVDGAPPDPATDIANVGVVVQGSTAADAIKSTQLAMLALSKQMGQQTAQQLLPAIDVVLDDHVKPFVALRDQLVEAMGLARAAPVLLTMAQGERLLNRAWSAAADGYLQESHDSIAAACSVFKDALEQLVDAGEGV